MTSNLKPFLCAVAAIAVLGVSTASYADTQWQKDHPRREQVNNRLRHQTSRIHSEVKDGDLTHSQAAQLHKDDAQIRQEERDMASQNNSHITKQEQRTLNQQENAVSRQIGQ